MSRALASPRRLAVHSHARASALAGLACGAALGPAIAQAAGSRLSLRPSTPGAVAPSAGAPGERPVPALLPGDDDWSWLDAYAGEPDAFDGLKRIALDGAGRARLSLGALAYLESERYRNDDFGRGPDDGYANVRLNLYAGLELGTRWRLFGALKHGAQPGARTSPSPVAREDADLHQAFVELALGDAFGLETSDATLRLGRFELHYGAGRMVSVREGPNVRGDVDGLLARLATEAGVTDLFVVRDVEDGVGAFDNARAEDGLWGLYSAPRPDGDWLGKPEAYDVYYIGERAHARAFSGGATDETRHSIGLRHYTGGGPGWTSDVELTLQYARLGGGTDALASAGHYFGDTSPFGPGNLGELSLVGAISPGARVTLEAGTLALWRLRTEDATYTPSNRIAVGADGNGRWIGAELGLGAIWEIDFHWVASAAAAHFLADGRYLADNDASEDITRYNLAVDFRF